MSKYKPIEIMKHTSVFNVADMGEQELNNFCISQFANGKWEAHTFHIFDKYASQYKVMVDIGAWIGITPMYASTKYNRVIAYEVDKEALLRLKANLNVNPLMDNIILVEKAISDKNGTAQFGCKDQFGDSESSLFQTKNSYEVETTTLQTSLLELGVEIHTIGLIKMDIEGAEKLVIPNIIPLLRAFKTPLYLSIHHNAMSEKEMGQMLVPLFETYNTARIYNESGSFLDVGLSDIMKNKFNDITFSNESVF